MSLLEVVDSRQIDCLNEDSEHTLRSILGAKKLNTTSSYLVSDVDEQLLLNIPASTIDSGTLAMEFLNRPLCTL